MAYLRFLGVYHNNELLPSSKDCGFVITEQYTLSKFRNIEEGFYKSLSESNVKIQNHSDKNELAELAKSLDEMGIIEYKDKKWQL